MKIIYQSDRPKSRQKKYSPSGTCFSFRWEQVAGIIQEWRVKHGYSSEKENVEAVYVADGEVTFFIDVLK